MEKARLFEKKVMSPPSILKLSNKLGRQKKGPIRVFICGPHGAGKTTLIESLVTKNPHFAKRKEIARTYFQQKGITAKDVDPSIYPEKFEFFQKSLMDKQCSLEEADEATEGVILYDRGPDALVYITKYHPNGDKIRNDMLCKKNVKRALKRYRKSLVLLIQPQKFFETKDSVRMDSSFKDLVELYRCFRKIFKQLKIPYRVISVPDLNKRVLLVEKFISGFKLKQNISK